LSCYPGASSARVEARLKTHPTTSWITRGRPCFPGINSPDSICYLRPTAPTTVSCVSSRSLTYTPAATYSTNIPSVFTRKGLLFQVLSQLIPKSVRGCQSTVITQYQIDSKRISEANAGAEEAVCTHANLNRSQIGGANAYGVKI
jgi:hypothetical protein